MGSIWSSLGLLLTARMLSQVELVLEICSLLSLLLSMYFIFENSLRLEASLAVSGNWQHLKLPMWPWSFCVNPVLQRTGQMLNEEVAFYKLEA